MARFYEHILTNLQVIFNTDESHLLFSPETLNRVGQGKQMLLELWLVCEHQLLHIVLHDCVLVGR